MNYSLALKEELIAGAPHAKCCKHAYLRGLFFDAAATKEGAVVLKMASVAARKECARVYRDLFHKEALMNGATMLFSGQSLYRELSEGEPQFLCPHCRAHFLRGLLITCGSVTDPEKAYRLEISMMDTENAAFLTDFLEEIGFPPKIRTHRGGIGLYYKNSTVIEEILTTVGANHALFALMNAKITHGIRNEENRATNCVTQNIEKAVGASARCMEAIQQLREAAVFDKLPAELRETARLREENPAASLKELAELHSPAITKSGLTHRIQKILQFAKETKQKEN